MRLSLVAKTNAQFFFLWSDSLFVALPLNSFETTGREDFNILIAVIFAVCCLFVCLFLQALNKIDNENFDCVIWKDEKDTDPTVFVTEIQFSKIL